MYSSIVPRVVLFALAIRVGVVGGAPAGVTPTAKTPPTASTPRAFSSGSYNLGEDSSEERRVSDDRENLCTGDDCADVAGSSSDREGQHRPRQVSHVYLMHGSSDASREVSPQDAGDGKNYRRAQDDVNHASSSYSTTSPSLSTWSWLDWPRATPSPQPEKEPVRKAGDSFFEQYSTYVRQQVGDNPRKDAPGSGITGSWSLPIRIGPGGDKKGEVGEGDASDPVTPNRPPPGMPETTTEITGSYAGHQRLPPGTVTKSDTLVTVNDIRDGITPLPDERRPSTPPSRVTSPHPAKAPSRRPAIPLPRPSGHAHTNARRSTASEPSTSLRTTSALTNTPTTSSPSTDSLITYIPSSSTTSKPRSTSTSTLTPRFTSYPRTRRPRPTPSRSSSTTQTRDSSLLTQPTTSPPQYSNRDTAATQFFPVNPSTIEELTFLLSNKYVNAVQSTTKSATGSDLEDMSQSETVMEEPTFVTFSYVFGNLPNSSEATTNIVRPVQSPIPEQSSKMPEQLNGATTEPGKIFTFPMYPLRASEPTVKPATPGSISIEDTFRKPEQPSLYYGQTVRNNEDPYVLVTQSYNFHQKPSTDPPIRIADILETTYPEYEITHDTTKYPQQASSTTKRPFTYLDYLTTSTKQPFVNLGLFVEQEASDLEETVGGTGHTTEGTGPTTDVTEQTQKFTEQTIEGTRHPPTQPEPTETDPMLDFTDPVHVFTPSYQLTTIGYHSVDKGETHVSNEGSSPSSLYYSNQHQFVAPVSPPTPNLGQIHEILGQLFDAHKNPPAEATTSHYYSGGSAVVPDAITSAPERLSTSTANILRLKPTTASTTNILDLKTTSASTTKIFDTTPNMYFNPTAASTTSILDLKPTTQSTSNIVYFKPTTASTTNILDLKPTTASTSNVVYFKPTTAPTTNILDLKPTTASTSNIMYFKPTTAPTTNILDLKPTTQSTSNIMYFKPTTASTTSILDLKPTSQSTSNIMYFKPTTAPTTNILDLKPTSLPAINIPQLTTAAEKQPSDKVSPAKDEQAKYSTISTTSGTSRPYLLAALLNHTIALLAHKNRTTNHKYPITAPPLKIGTTSTTTEKSVTYNVPLPFEDHLPNLSSGGIKNPFLSKVPPDVESMLSSLINSTPEPVIAGQGISCKEVVRLSPLLDYYGLLYPGLVNPCKKNFRVDNDEAGDSSVPGLGSELSQAYTPATPPSGIISNASIPFSTYRIPKPVVVSGGYSAHTLFAPSSHAPSSTDRSPTLEDETNTRMTTTESSTTVTVYTYPYSVYFPERNVSYIVGGYPHIVTNPGEHQFTPTISGELQGSFHLPSPRPVTLLPTSTEDPVQPVSNVELGEIDSKPTATLVTKNGHSTVVSTSSDFTTPQPSGEKEETKWVKISIEPSEVVPTTPPAISTRKSHQTSTTTTKRPTPQKTSNPLHSITSIWGSWYNRWSSSRSNVTPQTPLSTTEEDVQLTTPSAFSSSSTVSPISVASNNTEKKTEIDMPVTQPSILSGSKHSTDNKGGSPLSTPASALVHEVFTSSDIVSSTTTKSTLFATSQTTPLSPELTTTSKSVTNSVTSSPISLNFKTTTKPSETFTPEKTGSSTIRLPTNSPLQLHVDELPVPQGIVEEIAESPPTNAFTEISVSSATNIIAAVTKTPTVKSPTSSTTVSTPLTRVLGSLWDLFGSQSKTPSKDVAPESQKNESKVNNDKNDSETQVFLNATASVKPDSDENEKHVFHNTTYSETSNTTAVMKNSTSIVESADYEEKHRHLQMIGKRKETQESPPDVSSNIPKNETADPTNSPIASYLPSSIESLENLFTLLGKFGKNSIFGGKADEEEKQEISRQPDIATQHPTRIPHYPHRVHGPVTVTYRPFSAHHRNDEPDPRMSTLRPAIILKKQGSRFRVPLIPSADFSSFQPYSSLPPREGMVGPIMTPIVPLRPPDTLPPNIIRSRLGEVDFERPNNVRNDVGSNERRQPPFGPRPVASSGHRQRRCGKNLRDRLDYLLGRELVMDQFGARVYSSVVESILTAECNTPEEPNRGPLPLLSPTPLPQQNLPASTSAFKPVATFGMEGWLTLDDLRAKAEEERLQKHREALPQVETPRTIFPTSSYEDLLRNHRLTGPFVPTAAPLSATPNHLTTTGRVSPPVASLVTTALDSTISLEGTPLASFEDPEPSQDEVESREPVFLEPPSSPRTTSNDYSPSVKESGISASSLNLFLSAEETPFTNTQPDTPSTVSVTPMNSKSSTVSPIFSDPMSTPSTNPPPSFLPTSNPLLLSVPSTSEKEHISTSTTSTSDIPSTNSVSHTEPTTFTSINQPAPSTLSTPTSTPSSTPASVYFSFSSLFSSASSTSTPSPPPPRMSPGSSRSRRFAKMLRSPPGIALGAGMLALNNVALAAGSPIGPSEASPSVAMEEPTSRAVGTTVFGFETILTGLVYLSFGIFLYQMIQRAVDAKVLGSFTASSSGRDAGHFEATSLLQSLEEMPEVASEMMLVGMTGAEVWSQRPSCLPLYLCRVNSPALLPQDRQPAVAMASSAVTLWAGLRDPKTLLDVSLAAWKGANGYSCDFALNQCQSYRETPLHYRRDNGV